MSYEAIVCRLSNVREHPNADRLKLATVAGYQIVVGLDSSEDELGVFFPSDGKVSTDYCINNKLYPEFDESGRRIGGGFFDPKNNRVRSQRFRGEKSEGYFAPLESLRYTGIDISSLHEGYTFSELNGKTVCEKYYSPATIRALQGNQGKARKTNVMFPKQVDTLRWQYESDRLVTEGSLCYVTEKLHGTSGRVSLALEENPGTKRWYHKLLRREPKVTTTWEFLVGTRNLVLKDPIAQGFYADDTFRFNAVESLRHNLHKGEVIYGELVGWASVDTPIMSRQDTKELKDIAALYGPSITYSYGTVPGECKFYVYRIARVNEDGNLVELPWSQVKARCSELGLLIVPDMIDPVYIQHDVDKVGLKITIDNLMEGHSTLDKRHIREGVVVRVESPTGETHFLKSKSFSFGVLEGYLKNSDDYVDTEEST